MTSLYEGVVRLYLGSRRDGWILFMVIYFVTSVEECQSREVDGLDLSLWDAGPFPVVVKTQTDFACKLVNYIVVIIRSKETETPSPISASGYDGLWVGC